MIFDWKNSGISEDDIKNAAAGLMPYLAHLQDVAHGMDYSAPESSLCLPEDSSVLGEVKAMLEKHPSLGLKYIFLIGIGGSNLGAKAVYDALRGPNELWKKPGAPRIIFVETISSSFLEGVLKLIEENVTAPEEVLVNIISKSGSTLETIANAEILLGALKRKFGDMSHSIVVTTDEGSKLDAWADEHGADTLHIPAAVGGRYSVFSTVGLFPLALCGFDIEALLRGAASMNVLCLAEDAEANPALRSALATFANYRNGKSIADHFFFAPELESVGKWCRQLMAESLGKEKDLAGSVVNAGITPTVSIGSTDLHSMVQLYLGGPKDRFTNFITLDGTHGIAVPDETSFDLGFTIEGKLADDILEAIYGGVKAAYAAKGMPFTETKLHSASEESLGEYMQFKMVETMLLGSLMNINAFDQSAVEDYKTETKRILESL